ncbi:type VII secretion target [Actinokineospora inagensis]|uniref:type VII secretion target n=1 Tax=Actinokineospora inagensis TaxID=103730 RepID=UPI00040C5239|nr:type VII secretion target [Actinokineospora inagensis]
MSGFDVNLGELRAHAATVAEVASEVSAATSGAQATSGNAFGVIGSFFAQAILAASGDVGEAFTKTAQAYQDVRSGLTTVADDYQRIDEAHAQVFGGGSPSTTPAGTTPAGSTPSGTQPQYSDGQRSKAIEVLEKISKEHPVSVATVAIKPVKWLNSWAGNVLSGHIGDHYERDAAAILASPPTNANLRTLADRETKFWNSDQGNWAGRMVSADRRYSMLVDSRTEWLAAMPADQRAQVKKDLGL